MTNSAPTRPSRRRRTANVVDPVSASAPIRTRALTKRYGDFVAVDTLDLEVRSGEIFGLLGQNGAGKTTTILMLLGLTEPSGGTARVVGLDPARRPLEVKRRVGYLPDAFPWFERREHRRLRAFQELGGVVLIEECPTRRIHEILVGAIIDEQNTAVGYDRRGTRLGDATIEHAGTRP